MWGEKMFREKTRETPMKTTIAPTPYAPPPLRCPPTPKQSIAIKNLRMIANDIENGFDGFNFLLGYDFCNMPFDIEEGKNRREKTNEKKEHT